jgi:hypothetical protein
VEGGDIIAAGHYCSGSPDPFFLKTKHMAVAFRAIAGDHISVLVLQFVTLKVYHDTMTDG